MSKRVLPCIFALLLSISALGQSMVSYYLSPQSDISRGSKFLAIEEISEVIIRGRSPIPYKVEKQFNTSGNIVSQVALNSAGGRTSETTWEYIDGNKITKRKHRFFINITGWNEEEVIIEWDETLHLPKKIQVLKNGNLWQWALTNFDTLGRVESAKVFSSSGAYIFSERLMYLEPSNMVKVMVFKSNGLFSSTTSFPLDAAKPFEFESVSREFYPNGDIKIDTLSGSGKGDQAYYYEYEYDSQGNWIEKRTFQASLGKNNKIKNKNLENKVTRKITYQ